MKQLLLLVCLMSVLASKAQISQKQATNQIDSGNAYYPHDTIPVYILLSKRGACTWVKAVRGYIVTGRYMAHLEFLNRKYKPFSAGKFIIWKYEKR